MIVKIIDYNESELFILYEVFDLDKNQLDFLKNNLDGDCKVNGNILRFKNYFQKDIFPFKSAESKLKIEDFKAREEIEMTFFLTSLLEDLI